MGKFINGDSFIKKQERPSLVKDFLASRRAHRQWTRNRIQMMSALKDFHHSMEGRRLHRKLGRYLATRDVQKGGLFGLSGRELFTEELMRLPEDILMEIVSEEQIDQDTLDVLEREFPEIYMMVEEKRDGIIR